MFQDYVYGNHFRSRNYDTIFVTQLRAVSRNLWAH
jgi:hypothetical protein